ncbi:MAG: hypothetical protein VX608_01445 [Chloroflexota bacterium]|nr:hypothetical protein [Chloroflexota bacterium]
MATTAATQARWGPHPRSLSRWERRSGLRQPVPMGLGHRLKADHGVDAGDDAA